MERVVALVAAGALAALAGWLGYSAWSLMTLDAAQLDALWEATDIELNPRAFQTYLYHVATVRAWLTLATVVPIPALLRIAARDNLKS